jgi:hypothetical protein
MTPAAVFTSGNNNKGRPGASLSNWRRGHVFTIRVNPAGQRAVGRRRATSSRVDRLSDPELPLGVGKTKFNSVLLNYAHPVASAAASGWVQTLKPQPLTIVSDVTNNEVFAIGPIGPRDAELLVGDTDCILHIPVNTRLRSTVREPCSAQGVFWCDRMII